MELDDLPDQRQAEAQSAVAAARRGVRLAEPIEDIRQELAADALAGVAHDQLDASTSLFETCTSTRPPAR